jgi:hypothetical protein
MRTRLALLLILASLASCTALAGPRDPDPRHLSVELEADGAVLAPGDALSVVVTIRNRSTHSVRLEGLKACPPWGFEVLQADGSAVPLEPQTCTLLPGRWTIPGRGSLADTLAWTGTTGMNGAGEPLPPGRYHLVGVVTVLPPGFQLRSAPVAVDVVPA